LLNRWKDLNTKDQKFKHEVPPKECGSGASTRLLFDQTKNMPNENLCQMQPPTKCFLTWAVAPVIGVKNEALRPLAHRRKVGRPEVRTLNHKHQWHFLRSMT
jgi:hypothetical protein